MAFNRDQATFSGGRSPEKLAARIQSLMEKQSRLQAKIQLELAALGDIAESRAKQDGNPKVWDLEYRTLGNEVGARVRLTGATVTTMMANAQALVSNLPATHAALGKGQIRFEHAKVMDQESRILHNFSSPQLNPEPYANPAEAAEQARLAAAVTEHLAKTSLAEAAATGTTQEQIGEEASQAARTQIITELFTRYEAAVLPHAYNKTPNQVRNIARRVANQLTGATLEQRHEIAAAERCVFVEPLNDGMAKLSAVMEASLAYGIFNRLTRQAKTVITANRATARQTNDSSGSRSTDQIRTDLLTDLLLTAAPTGHLTNGLEAIQAHVQITIPLLGLLTPEQQNKVRTQNPALRHIAGIDGNPSLAGYGPMSNQTARNLTGGAPGLDRIFIDPIVGSVLETDRYTPNADLKRFLTARDIQCRFIGCNVKAARAETDHTVPFSQGGRTTHTNMQFLCKNHHDLKHHSWSAALEPNGDFKLTSPHGQEYVQKPMSQTVHQPPPVHPGKTPYFSLHPPSADANGRERAGAAAGPCAKIGNDSGNDLPPF